MKRRNKRSRVFYAWGVVSLQVLSTSRKAQPAYGSPKKSAVAVGDICTGRLRRHLCRAERDHSLATARLTMVGGKIYDKHAPGRNEASLEQLLNVPRQRLWDR